MRTRTALAALVVLLCSVISCFRLVAGVLALTEVGIHAPYTRTSMVKFCILQRVFHIAWVFQGTLWDVQGVFQS
jgi:hypothetical protein